MKLAWRELVRRPGRFAVAGAILTLIAILLMFLGGLLDGLIANSTGALRAQQADRIVYSDTSKDSITRSRIEPEVRAQVEAAVGDGAVGGLGLGAARRPAARPWPAGPRARWSCSATSWPPRASRRRCPRAGEVYADSSLEAEGVEEGMVVKLGPARIRGHRHRLPVRQPVLRAGHPVGIAWTPGGRSLSPTAPTRWSATTWSRPSWCVDAADDPASSAAIDEATDGATSTLTIDEAITRCPASPQQQATFNQIIGVTVVIAIVVVALFFALLTVERIGLYGVLKAVGASSRTLFGGVVLQAVVITLCASALGAAAALALGGGDPRRRRFRSSPRLLG